MSGPIRFVGGPLHNEHRRIAEWHPYERYLEPRPLVLVLEEPDKPRPFSEPIFVYELRKMWFGKSPAFFWEYHLAGRPEGVFDPFDELNPVLQARADELGMLATLAVLRAGSLRMIFRRPTSRIV